MGEFQALEHLVVLRQQQGDWAGAGRLAVELDALGGKLREGSEAPFARALLALVPPRAGRGRGGRPLSRRPSRSCAGPTRSSGWRTRSRGRRGWTSSAAGRVGRGRGPRRRAGPRRRSPGPPRRCWPR